MKIPTSLVPAIISLLLPAASLHAQNYGMGPSSNTFAGTSNLSTIVAGSHNHVAAIRSAILAGYDSTIASTATYSTILASSQCTASAPFSVVAGVLSSTHASANYSLSMGNTAKTMAAYSFSFGYKAETGGTYSFAFGNESKTTGAHSLAFGSHSEASGTHSLAFGNLSHALANYAIAMGEAATASGAGSLAIGTGATANSFRGMALGSFPVLRTDASATTWVATDPLLTVSNGETDSARSNAMVVLKNGAVLIKPSGDLSMGTFTEGMEPDDTTVPAP